MRILVSGASGMIGSAIVEQLRGRGDEVGALVRHGRPSSGLDVAWDVEREEIDQAALTAGEFDVVMHLAGESLLGRWTEAKRQRIRDSRVHGTRLIARAIADLDRRPSALLVASATGWYGDRGEELLTEESTHGAGFLANVVAEWEAAAEPARQAGIRTAHLRMAPVQGTQGGALKAQLLPFRLGVGGKVGSGRQWWPWIGVTEAARVWCFAADTPEFEGPVNVVGPTPCRNIEYVKSLGRVLGRPTFMPAPVPLMKLALTSDLIEESLLLSQKIVPARLEGLEYEFLDRTVEDAFRRELGR
jgi:uncharacterized protein (TIGR01777 family)